MGKKCVVIFKRDTRNTIFDNIAALQYTCKKEQAHALAALMAKCQGVIEKIDQSGSAALTFDPDNEFEMTQLELLTLAMTGIALKSPEIIDSMFGAGPERDAERKAVITALIGRFYPSLN